MIEEKIKLVFATNNAHKIDEARQIVGERFVILSLKDLGCEEDIPENEPTLEGNARNKAKWIKEHYGYDCFADDTGLEVAFLNGEPGVKSARYASEKGHDSAANMALVLERMKNAKNRDARFRTVIALLMDGKEILFEGIVKGRIAEEPSGDAGFGYDPIFIPEEDSRTFAEYEASEKNAISHRGRAMKALMEYLKNQTINKKRDINNS